jgi:hypothetical protein
MPHLLIDLITLFFVLKFLNVDKPGWSAAERFWGPSKQTYPLVIGRIH